MWLCQPCLQKLTDFPASALMQGYAACESCKRYGSCYNASQPPGHASHDVYLQALQWAEESRRDADEDD